MSATFLQVKAADFESVVNREFTLHASGEYLITETHTISNQSKNRLISKSNKEIFQIIVLNNENNLLEEIVKEARLFIDGTETQFVATYTDKTAEINVTYPREVNKGQSIEFKLVYRNPGLMNKTGALTDLYIPGFAKDFSFTRGDTSIEYNTTVKINKSLAPLNFTVPDPIESTEDNDFRIMKYKKEDLVGRMIWIQLGKVQYYHFKLVEEAPATDIKNTGYQNEYRLIIPRDIEEYKITQKVYFKTLDPEPDQIIEDQDGNLVGYFKVDTDVNTQITIEGYAAVSINENKLSAEMITNIASISPEMVTKYTGTADFWEVDALEIKSLSNELLQGSDDNVFTAINNNYKYVVDHIDYSQVKRFGLNERKGALKTLQEGSGVCMEYSDLFLTLTRAQQIPARAAFGYGYDSRVTSSSQEAHQWVQTYMPGINQWITIDVTWGESGPALIGGDLNHFFTHVASVNPDAPAMVERISYGKEQGLTSPKIDIEVLGEIVDLEKMQTAKQVLEKYPEKQKSNLLELLNKIGINSPKTLVSIVFTFLGITLMIFALFQLIAVIKSPIKYRQ